MIPYPDDMDGECVRLCDVLNMLPRIETNESCAGHGKHPHRVFFWAATVDALTPILMAIESSGWFCEARWVNGPCRIGFMLQGPVGAATDPGNADDLAGWIEGVLR